MDFFEMIICALFIFMLGSICGAAIISTNENTSEYIEESCIIERIKYSDNGGFLTTSSCVFSTSCGDISTDGYLCNKQVGSKIIKYCTLDYEKCKIYD